jgi:hypothetical protein
MGMEPLMGGTLTRLVNEGKLGFKEVRAAAAAAAVSNGAAVCKRFLPVASCVETAGDARTRLCDASTARK